MRTDNWCGKVKILCIYSLFSNSRHVNMLSSSASHLASEQHRELQGPTLNTGRGDTQTHYILRGFACGFRGPKSKVRQQSSVWALAGKVQWSGSRRADRTNLLWLHPQGAALIAAKSLLQGGIWQVPIPCFPISLVASFPQGCFCVSLQPRCIVWLKFLSSHTAALPFLSSSRDPNLPLGDHHHV